MTNYTIDNTDKGDIKRSILWQYDNATKLIAFIECLSNYFKTGVTDFWNAFIETTDISERKEDSKLSDFGLAIWGKVVGVSRNIGPNRENLSSGLYRKILLARIGLSNSNASLKAYSDFVYAIFGGKVKFVDNGNMSLILEATETLTVEEQELLNNPDAWMLYPAGVKRNELSERKIFGLSDKGTDPQDDNCGGLDNSTFNWR